MILRGRGGDWALTNCQNGTIEDQIWNNKPENVRFMIWSSRIIFSFGFGMYAFEHELKKNEKKKWDFGRTPKIIALYKLLYRPTLQIGFGVPDVVGLPESNSATSISSLSGPFSSSSKLN